MTQGLAPPRELLELTNRTVMTAHALPLSYRAGERDEDTAREKLGAALLWVCANDPKYKPWTPRVADLIERGRRGDERADRAVRETSEELIETAEETRSVWERFLVWLDRLTGKKQTAARALVTSAAAV